MANLANLVANSLWFAFDALDYHKTGTVPKSQLKVLTQNIGVILCIDRRVEECLHDYLSVKQLTFDQFLYFLVKEVFAEVDDGHKCYRQLKTHHDQLDKAFWDLCRPGILARHQPVLSPECLYKVFRIFCLLADRRACNTTSTQVTLPRGEVEEITRCLVDELGRDWDPQDFKHISVGMTSFSLAVFLTFVEGRYLQEVEPAALHDAVQGAYQFFIEQVLEKSKMHQRLSWAPVWITREMEVVPWEIRPTKPNFALTQLTPSFASSPLAILTTQTTVHGIADCEGARPRRITVCANKNLQLAAPDHKLKARWLKAINIAIEHSRDAMPYQKLVSSARKEDRAHLEHKEMQDKMRRASQADIIEQTEAQLAAERQAREEAEASAREEAAARHTEEKRVQELINLKHELEQLLQQETQAKRDEEIVRTLQARVLTEEWEKREELEKLQEEQRLLLEQEKEKRHAFEKIQVQKESQLKEAEEKLAKLEKDRRKLDMELRSAREKIVMSERGKEIIEARMKVKERKPPSRTLSLRPVRREQTNPPVRSSSFNTQAHRVMEEEESRLQPPHSRSQHLEPSSASEGDPITLLVPSASHPSLAKMNCSSTKESMDNESL